MVSASGDLICANICPNIEVSIMVVNEYLLVDNFSQIGNVANLITIHVLGNL